MVSYLVTLYGKFLEGIFQQAGCAEITTPVPFILKGDPLNHINLARSMNEEYGDVLCDEYGWIKWKREKWEGEEYDEDEGSEKDLGYAPIIGLRHYLGARILTVVDAYPEEILRPPQS